MNNPRKFIRLKVFILSATTALVITSSLAQIDTTRREFWPLGLGDLWQYHDEYGRISRTSQVVVVDTQLPNGRRYAAITGEGFHRVDSLLRVQWYAPWGSDTCGGTAPSEVSVYRLGEESGTLWRDCFNWNAFLGPPLVRYDSIYLQPVFGQWREVMRFEFGYISPETGDSVYPSQDLLARGIGLIWRDYFERGGFEYLAGAMINGVLYGTIVAVNDIPSTRPLNFTLHQNYPNPFNASTTIPYDLPERTYVRLTVHDALGREVASLVEQMQIAGRYQVHFDVGNLASGVYMYVLRTGNSMITRRMILLK